MRRMSSGMHASSARQRSRIVAIGSAGATRTPFSMLPQRFYKSQQAGQGDRHLYAVRTRFIPDRLLSHFEMRSRSAAAEAEPRRAAAAPQVDVGARLRGMWR